MKEHTYRYEKVIIGDSLAALLMGYHEGRPVITLNPVEPFFFETYDSDIDLSFLGLENNERVLNTPDNEIKVGIEKREVYRKVAMAMSLAGLLPFAGKAISMRQVEDKKVRVILDHARSAFFTFDSSVIVGNNILEPEIPPKYLVLDWIDVRSGMVHPFDRIEKYTDFVKCIHFYPSERLDGAHDKKDLVCVSQLTREQMNSYEYSDTYARFEVLDSMKNAGIRGARNGRDPNRPGKYKHYAVKLETNRRVTYPMYSEIDYTPQPTGSRNLKLLTDIF